MYNQKSAGYLTLTDCTLSGNTARFGGGMESSASAYLRRLHDQ